jgi:hypothetical protein
MLKSLLLLAATLSFFTPPAFAQAPAGAGKGNPCANPKLSAACQAICQKCSSSGYVYGQMGKGNGLLDDCVRPIVQGVAEPAKAQQTGHTLPTVDAATITQCKTANPRFGEGKIQ